MAPISFYSNARFSTNPFALAPQSSQRFGSAHTRYPEEGHLTRPDAEKLANTYRAKPDVKKVSVVEDKTVQKGPKRFYLEIKYKPGKTPADQASTSPATESP